MVYSLSYRRPAFVRRESYDSQGSEATSTNSARNSGIPDALSFDKIINDGTCPPVTTRDFMNYLTYIEHSAENLQFFLWYRGYVERFNNADTSDISLAPEWTDAQQDAAVQAAKKKPQRTTASHGAAEIFKGTDFEKEGQLASKNPFLTPPRTPQGSEKGSGKPWDSVTALSSQGSTLAPTSSAGATLTPAETFRQAAGETFESVGLKRPFSIQPFREEIDRVVVTYVQDNAPRQINISYIERYALLRALQDTTHPSALRAVNKTVEMSLRRQSHPNFIRWTICNGNPPRVLFARALGVGGILLGTLAAIIITLSDAGRGWRALCAIGWVVGISTLFAAWKGMCVVLHGMHHRHLRPWEMFEDADSEMKMKTSFDSFASSNSYEDEPWVKKYEKRNIIRKIFDRETWIQEPALRQIQDTIFLQGMLLALTGGAILTLIFVLVPGGHLF